MRSGEKYTQNLISAASNSLDCWDVGLFCIIEPESGNWPSSISFIVGLVSVIRSHIQEQIDKTRIARGLEVLSKNSHILRRILDSIAITPYYEECIGKRDFLRILIHRAKSVDSRL